MPIAGVQRASYRRPGRLTPRRAGGLRAGAVRLSRRELMDWHSTRRREELLIALQGELQLELQPSRDARGTRRLVLRAGQYAFLPQWTRHRVVNRSARGAHYLYVTAPAPSASAHGPRRPAR